MCEFAASPAPSLGRVDERPTGAWTRHLFAGILIALAIATAVAMIALWPGEREDVLSEGLTAPTQRAEVTEVTEVRVRRPSRAPA